MTALLAAGALTCAQTAPAAGQGVAAARLPGVIKIVVLPPATTVGELARIPGASVGAMSTGIGNVPPEQTYLDISQGNRVDDALYDRPLPPLRSTFLRVPRWSQVVRRAEAAPADVVPGLLGSRLLDAAIRPQPAPRVRTAAIMVADRSGEIGRVVGGPAGAIVLTGGIATVGRQARTLPAGGLLISFAKPSAGSKVVPIGIIGTGFRDRNLTSDSTRTDGYVLSTDLAPTILRRLGLPIPGEMDGEEIRPAGVADPAAVDRLVGRMVAIPDRREPILVACILAWLLVAFAVHRVVAGLRRESMAWLALCFAYMPLMLLAGAWLEPSAIAEGLLVGLGSAALAALTVRLVRGWRGLAIACAITVIAYAIDVVAGSGLTRLALLGPNPIFGARFYGIGNELEALFAVMVPVGVGAGLTAYSGWGRGVTRSRAVLAFLGAGLAGAIIFGAGRFGADVGAAIVLPVGCVTAACTLSADFVRFTSSNGVNGTKSSWSRIAAAVVGSAFVALVLLVGIDLVSGGNAHLTRSVIDAGGASDLSQAAQRRLELCAHDFARAARNPLFWIVVVGIGVAVSQRRRVDAWLRPAPIAHAALIGAGAAVAAGVLVNDSGATFLVLGGLALGAFLAYAWSQAPESAESQPGAFEVHPGEIRSSPRNRQLTGG